MVKRSLLLFHLSLILFSAIYAHSKPLDIKLSAKWTPTPIVAEISEFLSANDKLHWQFLERIEIAESATQKEQLDTANEILKEILSPTQKDFLDYVVALRYFSPKVEALRHFYSGIVDSLDTSNVAKVEKCMHGWIQAGSEILCSAEGVDFSSLKGSEESNLDHFGYLHPSSSSDATIVLFYAAIGSPAFHKSHAILKELAQTNKIRYIFHPIIPQLDGTMSLSGYGIELAIKNLEYKTVDDTKSEESNQKQGAPIEHNETDVQGVLFGKLKENNPDLSDDLSGFKAYLLANDEKFEDLKVWSIKDLAFQASQRIAASENPLRTLREISQNLPTVGPAISKMGLNSTFKSNLENQRNLLESMGFPGNFISINGRYVDAADVDPYQIFRILSDEAIKLQDFRKLKMSKDDILKMMSLSQAPKQSFVFDVRSPAVIFLNDLAREPQYASWPGQVTEVLRRAWPGSFRFISNNLFNVLMVIDPTNPAGLAAAAVAENLVLQNAPLRFGLLMVTENPVKFGRKLAETLEGQEVQLEENLNLKFARLIFYIKETYGGRQVAAFFKLTQQFVAVNEMSESILKIIFNNFLQKFSDSDSDGHKFDAATTQRNFDEIIREANRLAYERGMNNLPAYFMNGVPLEAKSSEEIVQSIINAYFPQLAEIQEHVQSGELTNGMDVYDFLLSREKVLKRFNGAILGVSKEVKVLPLTGVPQVAMFHSPEAIDLAKPITHFVVGDFSKIHAIEVARAAINFLEKSSKVRIGFVHNPSEISQKSPVASAIRSLDSQLTSKKIQFLKNLFNLKVENLNFDAVKSVATETKLSKNFETAFSSDFSDENSQKTLEFFNQELGIPKGMTAVVTNGRVIEISPEESFAEPDFELLTSFEIQQRVGHIVEALATAKFDVPEEEQTGDFMSDVIMKVASFGSAGDEKRFSLSSHLQPTFTIPGDGDETFSVTAVINPTSKSAQRLSPMLETLVEFFNLKLEVILTPVELSEFPLKSFYTYVTPKPLQLDSQGEILPMVTRLEHLPSTRLLTLNLDLPEPWLVTPRVAKDDLDNLKLEKIEEPAVQVEFQLDYVVVEGNCYDTTNKGRLTPPRGLEIVLGTKNRTHIQDTIVMSNLGYYQLKANPGIWELNLKPSSRSSELFDILDDGKISASQRVAITDFSGNFVPLRVQKKADKINEDLLTVPEKDAVEVHNAWDSFSGMFGSTTETSNETIHVFSLATGHLYERFLKIMILSVLKQTKQPVKFWLLANFLSPKFKDFIPIMAKHYNFDYALVTYKWPTWLHKQTEKQRVIWGYKILFLDVLFPLDLKKVIYVDADQVVRSDLMELWKMDLMGAPYGYTPFCNSNHATDGFRFWDSGFWQSHLRGLPYHISALYVVDLVQFRRLAAGDNLRATYSQLSQDPNSLANLDQDLPNYLQHMVKIHSLPQEWLWCETWCDQESKSRAKTIDLCNNPLTKTPKLENAVKIIPEWTSLDNEIKTLENSVGL